ncbi:MAG: MMPL family transporter, partial [Bauldia sp.]
MSRLTSWVLAHKLTVVIAWIVLTAAGIAASGPAVDNLKAEFSVPGKEGWETSVEITERYGGTGGDVAPPMPVVTLPEGSPVDDPAVLADLRALDRRLAEALPGARIASYASTGDKAFISDDGSTAYAIVYARPDDEALFGENPRAEEAASAAIADLTVAGEPVKLTGFDALAQDSGAGGEGLGVLLEALLGGLGELLVLIFVFAS